MSATNPVEGLQPLVIVALHIADSEDDADFIVRRLRVPGGWLVITSGYLGVGNGMSVAVANTFVPDESGAWLDLANPEDGDDGLA